MTKRPAFTRDDFENPDAPKGERRLRADHPEVRDLSYERSRLRQVLDLYKGALLDPGWEPHELDDPSTWQRDRLELYLKERARGEGYVADFIYNSADLPVTVYGILINRGRGLEVAELELFRTHWGYFDDHGRFTDGEDEDDQGDQDEEQNEEEDEEQDDDQAGLITSDMLRRIPLGTILAKAQKALAQEDWRQDGITVLVGPDRGPDELTEAETAALEAAVRAAADTRRGRPELPDALLDEVAHAYLDEATAGAGLTHRLAARFDRPEATVRDWVGAARRRGYLSLAVPGRRGASPGPRLSSAPSTRPQRTTGH